MMRIDDSVCHSRGLAGCSFSSPMTQLDRKLSDCSLVTACDRSSVSRITARFSSSCSGFGSPLSDGCDREWALYWLAMLRKLSSVFVSNMGLMVLCFPVTAVAGPLAQPSTSSNGGGGAFLLVALLSAHSPLLERIKNKISSTAEPPS